MKVPKARKLPSGSWFCRVRTSGQDISITCATEKEAVAKAMAVKAGIQSSAKQLSVHRKNMSVAQAVDEYINARENVLSPSTLRGYHTIRRMRFKAAMNLKVCDLSAAQWQQIVNKEARLCSAKTLKNAWALLSSAIAEATDNTISVRLPEIAEKDAAFLSAEQIPVFVEAIRGKSFEIPALLALSSLRRSEILALRWEDIDLRSNTIQVAGAAVIGSQNKLIQKDTNKNRNSRRIVPIIPPLRDAILRHHDNSGLIVTSAPNTLYIQINRICRANGLPEVGVQGLRRSFASLAYHLGLSEEMTMRIGGWSNIYTMRRIYTKLSDQDISAQSKTFQDFFLPTGSQNGNKNDNTN